MTADLADTWDQALAATDMAAPTRRRYVGVLRSFLAWHEAQLGRPFDPRRKSECDLAAYHQHRQALGHRPGTLNLVAVALRLFADWLHETGQWDESAARRFKLISAPASLAPEALTPAALDALARAIQRGRYAARNEALLQLLLQTDILPAECEVLRLGDLTLGPDAGQLVVRAGQRQRVIALNASARAALVRYLAEQWGVEDTLSTVLAVWEHQSPKAMLWTTQKGETLRARSLSRVLEELLAECIERGLVPVGTSPRALRGMVAALSLDREPGGLVVQAEGSGKISGSALDARGQ